ncbi:hypothetical protein KDA82_36515, partial [Streptomyces daliensis]|nr:hypothetical protein [Streptomyces daliensis]
MADGERCWSGAPRSAFTEAPEVAESLRLPVRSLFSPPAPRRLASRSAADPEEAERTGPAEVLSPAATG